MTEKKVSINPDDCYPIDGLDCGLVGFDMKEKKSVVLWLSAPYHLPRAKIIKVYGYFKTPLRAAVYLVQLLQSDYSRN